MKMYFRNLKDHPHWQEASLEILKQLDPDLLNMINEVFPAPFPPVDIYATDDEITVFLEISGQQEEDELMLSAGENQMEIKGFKKQGQILPIEGHCLSQEIFWGPFARTIALPYKIDPESLSIKCLKGILEIHFQRLSEENDLD